MDNQTKELNFLRVAKYTGPLVFIFIAWAIGQFAKLDPETLRIVQIGLLVVAVIDFFVIGWLIRLRERQG